MSTSEACLSFGGTLALPVKSWPGDVLLCLCAKRPAVLSLHIVHAKQSVLARVHELHLCKSVKQSVSRSNRFSRSHGQAVHHVVRQPHFGLQLCMCEHLLVLNITKTAATKDCNCASQPPTESYQRHDQYFSFFTRLESEPSLWTPVCWREARY